MHKKVKHLFWLGYLSTRVRIGQNVSVLKYWGLNFLFQTKIKRRTYNIKIQLKTSRKKYKQNINTHKTYYIKLPRFFTQRSTYNKTSSFVYSYKKITTYFIKKEFCVLIKITVSYVVLSTIIRKGEEFCVLITVIWS